MDKLNFVKTGLSLVVSVGVGNIVGNAIKHTTPSDLKLLTRLCVGVGTIVLTAVASDIASNYTEMKFDKTVDTFESLTKVIEA